MVEGLPFMFLLVSHLFVSGVTSKTITIENQCNYNVWPGIQTSTTVPLSTTGFLLKTGKKHVINVPPSWQGRFWGRSHCSTNSTGQFSCATGDCGSGKVECSGAKGKPLVTLTEFNLDSLDNQDFYNLSLVDSYKLGLNVAPLDGKYGETCGGINCVIDYLDETCPKELKVIRNSSEEQPIGCMDACKTFNLPRYCCTGEYSTPQKCQPTSYSNIFKNKCQLAYSYAFDDENTAFTCSNSTEYGITFCPVRQPTKTLEPPSASPFPAQTKNGTLEPPSESPFPAQTNNGTLEPPSESPFPAQRKDGTDAGTKQKSSWKLKLILGVSAALTMMIITVVAITVRTKHATDWNEKNVEAVVLLK
ncbi:PR5-like receptor kinase [Cardamine amara subsp. amara]|uniref:PR5-like receptor kinase n=1 Tax=Cardamine amara subsp. amara TaxID=228776 RepID=A0ABD1BYL4_CARAN